MRKEKPVIIIDYKDRRPIYEQIVEGYQKLIIKGILEPDTQLPSVRNLAMELSINPNTIQRAYTELERQGFIYSVKGRGSYIAANSRLLRDKWDSILSEVLKLVKEARDIGITQEEFIRTVNEGYKEGEHND
ncbi:MAG: GntR family transcriptional regulator [Herbinix sp.]|jgi:GntR family transcriptional regulator|nr:GntR family transcriptional regulator [Herbinix sp.]